MCSKITSTLMSIAVRLNRACYWGDVLRAYACSVEVFPTCLRADHINLTSANRILLKHVKACQMLSYVA